MSEGRVQRRLAAILAADVVGYSRLVEADEALTRARLRAMQAELVDPLIAADGGRIVKTMGDGILVEFPSVVDAVRCALEIQRLMRLRNAGISEAIRMELRIGVNTGDVIVEGDDIHGDGVNVAARLESLCEPGEVYVSGIVFEQADGKLQATFEDLGEQKLKNIAKPVYIYRAIGETHTDTEPVRRTANTPALTTDKPSIAVLPFDNLSNDPEQEYFSDGMAEDLITDISKISGVSVAARNSSFAFKGQSVDLKEIARKLGVRHIVEGSVRKMGNRLRINAQLIDGTDGHHVWAERYDGNMAEIFDFQDAIREKIVSALHVRLTPADIAYASRKPTNNVEAYDLFLKGRAKFYRYTAENLLEAKTTLEEAIEIDPNFAEAYAYLSSCHFWGWATMRPGFDGSLDRAYQLAEKGVALDGTSAAAVSQLGWMQACVRQYASAVENMEKAIALAPDDAEVYPMYGQVLNWLGNPEKALEMIDTAFSLEISPPPNWDSIAGQSYLLLRQYDQAESRFLKAIERAPQYTPALAMLTCTYVETNRLADARNILQRLLDIVPRYSLSRAPAVQLYQSESVRERFLDSLRKAGLPE